MSTVETARSAPRVLRIAATILLIVALVVVWLVQRYGQGFGWLSPAKQERVLLLYCYSTLDDVMGDRLLPAFRDAWQRERGETVEVVATFAGSGDITDRIVARYPAEVAIVSSEVDAVRLPVGWLSWRKLPHQGVLARTPLAIVTRPGNPHGIRSFEDLGRAGLELLHSDPATSGAAELAILAAYGSALRATGDPEEAYRQLLGIWRNVTVRLPTARDVRDRFETGEGDAFVTYEQDLLESPSRARIEGAVVHPVATIVAEPVVVRIDRNVDARNAELVDAFIEFLWTPEAQRALVDYGFRSVLPELEAARADLAPLDGAFTLGEVGGVTARREILDGVWKGRVLPRLERP